MHTSLPHRATLSVQTKARIHGTRIKHCPEKENCVCNFSDCPCESVSPRVAEAFNDVVNFCSGGKSALSEGLTYVPIEMPESDKQYLESLTIDADEIAKLFGYKQVQKYSTLQEEMIKGRFRTNVK
jgi:hypothetical protein